MIGSMMMGMSVVVLLSGMIGGIAMGMAQNFTLAPAHAHLNLIGGVLLFMFGLYYRLIPVAGATRLARVQGWLHMVSAIVFPAGIAVVLLHGHGYEAIPVAGALLTLVATGLFATVVIRDARNQRGAPVAAVAGTRPQLQPHPWHSQGIDSRPSRAPSS